MIVVNTGKCPVQCGDVLVLPTKEEFEVEDEFFTHPSIEAMIKDGDIIVKKEPAKKQVKQESKPAEQK